MLLKELINHAIGTLSGPYPESEAREMVLAYLCDTIGIRRHTHIIEPSYEVAENVGSRALGDFARMAEGEPLQYVTGKAPFYDRFFHVTPATLIPRPETELLCRLALNSSPSKAPRVLDLCTGSGCIAWTLALELPKSDVTAVDISEEALKVAAGQDFAEEISCTGASAPKFVRADVLADPIASLVPGSFDMILSNPPYVMDKEKSLMRPNVLEHEPHMALFVPDEDPLLFYRAVADWSAVLLSEQGTGLVEINESLGKQTADVFRASGFLSVRIIKDLNEKDRFVSFSWK